MKEIILKILKRTFKIFIFLEIAIGILLFIDLKKEIINIDTNSNPIPRSAFYDIYSDLQKNMNFNNYNSYSYFLNFTYTILNYILIAFLLSSLIASIITTIFDPLMNKMLVNSLNKQLAKKS